MNLFGSNDPLQKRMIATALVIISLVVIVSVMSNLMFSNNNLIDHKNNISKINLNLKTKDLVDAINAGHVVGENASRTANQDPVQSLSQNGQCLGSMTTLLQIARAAKLDEKSEIITGLESNIGVLQNREISMSNFLTRTKILNNNHNNNNNDNNNFLPPLCPEDYASDDSDADDDDIDNSDRYAMYSSSSDNNSDSYSGDSDDSDDSDSEDSDDSDEEV